MDGSDRTTTEANPFTATILAQLSQELNLAPGHVERVVALLDEGNTIPFLARYRKEQTGGLDEEALRTLQDRLGYLRNLAERKAEVLRLIDEQGALTPELRQAVEEATTLQRVEDLYRPFRPKRRTRASVARERGLQPLADWLLSRPATGAPEEEAARFVDAARGVEGVEDALAGARDIIAEQMADDPEVRQWVRQWTLERGTLVSEATDPQARTPYEQYYDFREAVAQIRPHRVLAINRGEREKALRVRIELPTEPVLAYLEGWLRRQGARRSPADPHLALAAQDGYQRARESLAALIGALLLAGGSVLWGWLQLRADVARRAARRPPAVRPAPVGQAAVGGVLQTLIGVDSSAETTAAGQRERLASWGWVDRERGIVRIPIEAAMRALVEDAGRQP